MNREQAERLLAALIFDDLDEPSKAELLAYLQTDDELRDRLADLRMATKLTRDAVNDGPDPVLGEHRLKQLKRLARTGKARSRVFRMPGPLAIAAVLVLGLVLIGMLLPSLSKTRYQRRDTALYLSERDTSSSWTWHDVTPSAPPVAEAESLVAAGRRRGQDEMRGEALKLRDGPAERTYASASGTVADRADRYAAGGSGGMGEMKGGMGAYGGNSGAGQMAGGMGGYGGGMMGGMGMGGVTNGAASTHDYDAGRPAGREATSERTVASNTPSPSQTSRPSSSVMLRRRTGLPELGQKLNTRGGEVAQAAAENSDGSTIGQSQQMSQFGRTVAGGTGAPARAPVGIQNEERVRQEVAKETPYGGVVSYEWSGPTTPRKPVPATSAPSPADSKATSDKQPSASSRVAGHLDAGRRVPVLGDKPILGKPFESSSELERNTPFVATHDVFFDFEYDGDRADKSSLGKSAIMEKNKLDDGKPAAPTTTPVQGGGVYTSISGAVEAPGLVRGPSGTPSVQESEVSTGLAGDVRLNEALNADVANLLSPSHFRVLPVNPWVMTDRDSLSTFALDVDTASYALCRRYIRSGYLPPVGAVRMEEFINAFDYTYPQRDEATFAVHAEGAPAPFAPAGQDVTLLKIAVKARTVGRDQRRAAHLVFVVDASASMGQPDRLPMVQSALNLLVDRLSETDRVSLVTCANEARLHLEAVSSQQKDTIRQTIDAIQPAGPTNLLAGLKLGYAIARRAFVAGQINQVVLCSDGVANVGQTEAQAVLQEVAQDRKQGITITCVGVGYGAYNDAFLEAMADQGDGRYVFLDASDQARDALVGQLDASLQTVTKDARIQVQFDPARVRRYRLIGYENRDIEDQRFRDDTVDAGEVGSGQCSTALYELELIAPSSRDSDASLGTVFVRYRDAETGQVEEFSRPLAGSLIRRRSVDEAPRFFLAAGVARFAEWLRESEHAQYTALTDIQRLLDHVSAALPLDRDVQDLAALAHQAEGLPRAPQTATQP